MAQSQFVEADLVPKAVADKRLQELHRLQESVSRRLNEAYVGTVQAVLVDGQGSNVSSPMRGRTPHNVLVEIDKGRPEVGTSCFVAIEQSSPFALRGVLVDHP